MDRREEDEGEFLPNYKTVKEFSTDGFKHVMKAVKSFQGLPKAGPSWDLYKSYPEYSRSMKNARSKMIPMMVSLLKHVNIPTSDFKSRDIDEKFDFLVDSNDELLERIGTSLDDAEGIFKKGDIAVVDKAIAVTTLKPPGTWGKRKLESLNSGPSESNDSSTNQSQGQNKRQIKKAIYRTRVNEKPQLKFAKPVDNSNSPFVPKLKEKPNSLKPLSILPEYTSKNEEFYGHPYAVELNRWEPKDNMLTKVTPTIPKPLNDTPVVLVGTPRELERMMYDLLNVKEIAVDLEHHSFRTYLGLTCTIQISSREKDYVIDGLSLREELGNLNEIFTDPKILKVFHGATNDMDWLQRDFGIYVVNMFDTYIAAKVLGLPQQSLQYLLGKYCDITQDKTWQLADWRLRPMPNEMLEYARRDTHFLLYIYEQMRNELIDAGNEQPNLLLSVYDQSRLTCLKRYEKPVSNAQLALRKTRRSLNNRQLYAFTEIYKWRDEIAREKDESLGYVLPNHMLLTIAEALPKEMNGILACCDPVPPLIHSNLGRLHKIITTARELPLQQQSNQKDKTEKKLKLKNWIVAVNSIHDIVPIEASELTSSTSGKFEEEIFTSSTLSKQSLATSSWPQPWTEPQEWRNFLNEKGRPSLRFNKEKVKKNSQRENQQQASAMSSIFGVPIVDGLTTPFERFEVSKKIIEMMKDPEKQKELDMSDPLVKTVCEAVMLVDESENKDDEDIQTPVETLAKVLDEGEFIPFNPMAEPAHNKKRKKKVKNEPWDDSNRTNRDDNEKKPEIGIGMDDADRDSVEEVEVVSRSDSKFMDGRKSKKTRRGRSGGSKLINRIKNVFHRKEKDKDRPKAEVEQEEGEIEDGEIDEVEVIEPTPPASRRSSNSNPSPPTKRMRHDRSNSGRNHGHGRGNFNNRGDRGRDQINSSPRDGRQNQRGRDRGKRGNNKAGIFKAFKKDHRSISFM